MKSLNFSRIARTFAVVCTAGVAAAASMLVASPAHAAPGEHCMIVLPEKVMPRCFDTFEQAKQFAESIGAIEPSKEGQTAPQAIRAVAAAAGGLTLLSIEFDLPAWNFLGAEVWVYGSAGPCTPTIGDVDYELPDWAVFGFDQKISSFLTYGKCWTKHYDLVNFGGLAVGYQASNAVMNASINNDTSSERWS